MAAWTSALPFLLVAALIAVENRISAPSCSVSGEDTLGADHPNDLKVMMVADLLLPGPDAGYADLFFRIPYTSRFFRKSFQKLKPDMLIVLGDISARGSELTERKWGPILQQFYTLLGPFAALPYLVVFGDWDVGECSKMDWKFVGKIAGNLPGLDSSGCSNFEINNVSFVSLNAVALLCSNNELRFDVEKVIERESFDLRSIGRGRSTLNGRMLSDEMEACSGNFLGRANDAASGSGPVLLIHFPLHEALSRSSGQDDVRETNLCNNQYRRSKGLEHSGIVDTGPYEWMHTLPPNATEYILQSLKPRMVFSAHTHCFWDHTHGDGTREVTVPAMTFSPTRGKPGFVLVTFRQNKAVRVCYCLLARELHVLTVYVPIFILLTVMTIVVRGSYLIT